MVARPHFMKLGLTLGQLHSAQLKRNNFDQHKRVERLVLRHFQLAWRWDANVYKVHWPKPQIV